MYGNVLLGPTAEDLDDKQATGSTAEGLATAARAGPPDPAGACSTEEVTAVYAGLRAATEHDDYQVRAHARTSGTSPWAASAPPV